MIDLSLTGAAVYDVVLLISGGSALRFGGRDERAGAMILIAGSGATALAFPYVIDLFGIKARYGVLVVDLAALVAFDFLMARSSQVWPMWVSGFQIAAIAVALASLLDPIAARPYVFIQGKFAYLMLIALDIATFRHWRQAELSRQVRSEPTRFS